MEQVLRILSEYGYTVTKNNVHAVEFSKGNNSLYYIPGSKLNLVVAPDIVIPTEFSYALYHNSNITAFPKRRNKGTSEIHYGNKIAFDNIQELERFVDWYDSNAATMLDDINIASVPIEVSVFDGKTLVKCPRCKGTFEKAPRCPKCGKLIKY